jgi:signal transduction histidine kinase
MNISIDVVGAKFMGILSSIEQADATFVRQDFSTDFHKLSHDLRTPLNAICGFAELLLLDGNMGAASEEYVRAILAGSEELKAAVLSFLERAELTAAAPNIPASRISYPCAQPEYRRSPYGRRSKPLRHLRSVKRSEPA